MKNGEIILIGSKPDAEPANHVVLENDPGIDHKHCYLSRLGNQLYVTDSYSTNGVFTLKFQDHMQTPLPGDNKWFPIADQQQLSAEDGVRIGDFSFTIPDYQTAWKEQTPAT
jgi:pSer/pThr/pTyr-binding forkhead associated (FHA) protein